MSPIPIYHFFVLFGSCTSEPRQSNGWLEEYFHALRSVRFSFLGKLTFHGYPMTTVQYFHAPQLGAMTLGSHDCMEKRVYQQLHHLCTVDETISKLTTLHLTLQCNEQVFIRVLKYLGPLQELVLSTADSSPSWEDFLKSLTAKPSTTDWPEWKPQQGDHQTWEEWCFSQTWHANVLPYLRYLGIQRPKGFSQSDCLNNCPLLRLVGWTRVQLAPPLEHLKVWEGRGTTDDINVVDYISTGYLDKHPGISSKEYDSMIVRGMITRRLVIHDSATPLFQLHSTVLFRQLQDLEVICDHDHEISILPYLEQIKRLEIWHGLIPEYSLNTDLPLIHTSQWLRLGYSTFSWMLGRTFKTLRELQVYEVLGKPENRSRHEGLQVDLPACTSLELWSFSVDRLHFLSCPNVQTLQWEQSPVRPAIDQEALKSLRDFFCNCSSLQKLVILTFQNLDLDSLIQFVFREAREKGAWRDIMSAEVKVSFTGSSRSDRNHFFNQSVGHQQVYEKWWKEFTVTTEDLRMMVIVRASM